MESWRDGATPEAMDQVVSQGHFGRPESMWTRSHSLVGRGCMVAAVC